MTTSLYAANAEIAPIGLPYGENNKTMATLNAYGVQIQMDFNNNIHGGFDTIPRADTCHHCAQPRSQHAQDKCLFGSTEFKALDPMDWARRFSSWASSKQIDQVILEIAYAATGGEPR